MNKAARLALAAIAAGAACALAGAAAATPGDRGDHHGDVTFCVAGVGSVAVDKYSDRYWDFKDGSTYMKTWTFHGTTHTYYSDHWMPGYTNTTVGEGACSTAGAQALPPPNSVFLCYSAFQTDPGVWSMDDAAGLMKQGYWSPYAVPGTAAGGTNIGDYHLACNVATGQSAGDSTLGGAGEVYGAGAKGDVQNVPGHYPLVGK